MSEARIKALEVKAEVGDLMIGLLAGALAAAILENRRKATPKHVFVKKNLPTFDFKKWLKEI